MPGPEDDRGRVLSLIGAFDRWLFAGFVALIGVAVVATSFTEAGVRVSGVAGGVLVVVAAAALWLALGRPLRVHRPGEPPAYDRGKVGLLVLTLALFVAGGLLGRVGT